MSDSLDMFGPTDPITSPPKDLGNPRQSVRKNRPNMGSPISTPSLAAEFSYRGVPVQVIECPPSGFLAVVFKDGQNHILVNPVRKDRFRRVESAKRTAKQFIRGKVYEP